MKRSLLLSGMAGALLSVSLAVAPTTLANAEDFFSALFRAFGGRHQIQRSDQWGPLSYGGEPSPQFAPRHGEASLGGPAYCVRSCDGRYFPAPPAGNQSRAEGCKSLCPAAETAVFYGRAIDDATGDTGRAYSELRNAYKYRSELVAGCSCNGTDPVGLASIKIEDDKTLRRGDIVTGPDSNVSAGKLDRRGVSMNFSPMSPTARSRYQRVPMVARD